jgi:hypothetical protein
VQSIILEEIFVFAGIVTGMGCLTGIIITYLKRRGRQIASSELAARLDDIVDRLSRLDGAVETVAVEVERISEAQRFTAKVLAERSAAALPEKRPGATTTPH